MSVAGRGSLSVFGLSWAPIGVDLEPVGETVEPAWNILHASERAWLEELAAEERHRAFLQIWTVKEAYLKMLGLGLRIEPAAVAVRIGASGAVPISRSAIYPIGNSSTLARPAPCKEGLGLGVGASLRSRVAPHPRQSSLRSSTPQAGGEAQAMQRAAHVPEAPFGAEWRQLMSGNSLVYVAVATVGS